MLGVGWSSCVLLKAALCAPSYDGGALGGEEADEEEIEDVEGNEGQPSFARISRDPRFQVAILRMCSARLGAVIGASGSVGAVLAGSNGEAPGASSVGVSDGAAWEAFAPALVEAAFHMVIARAGVSSNATGPAPSPPPPPALLSTHTICLGLILNT
jgi:hypothetical protein